MSHLDQHFAATAGHGLAVWPTPMPSESTLEPGFLYLVEGADIPVYFGIAARALADVKDQRVALKVITAMPGPGPIKISAPDGQFIEGDDGYIASGLVEAGSQALGTYREWMCDADGNWLLVGLEIDGAVAVAGQIVIKGIPVVIHGVPLVNTVPPIAAAGIALRSLPVSVATPAVIVPRPAAIAPAPLAGTTIELEDTFADASLEMDTAGEKFRVAELLQSEIENIALEVAAVVRFPFTLRTTSVSGTSYEEIGILRLDPTDLGAAFTLVAELEVSAAGQTAELQLYNLTAGAAVATLSSVSLVTQKRAASVTLPLSEALYSVRLRRTGGAAGQLVSCRSVTLER